jgi:rhodanese-related sulfurtransferase
MFPLSAQADDKAVDEVDLDTVWNTLQSKPRSQLVDVRTRAEWTYVGIPDLAPVGKRTVLGVELDDDLFFICRSGSRSLAAAKAMAAMGYRACHNVACGFEGPLDDGRHRGAVAGWKATGLPWQQS